MRKPITIALVALLTLASFGCPRSPAPRPSISLDQTTVDFGAQAVERTFQIWNGGDLGSTLRWNVRTTVNWINVSPPTGATTDPIDRSLVTVVLERNLLENGNNQGKLIISAPDTVDREIEVFATRIDDPLPSPVISTDVTSLDFGLSQTTKTFNVWNSGDAESTLLFSVTSSQPWLTVTPAEGTSQGVQDKVLLTVNVDRSNVSKSIQTGRISISAEGLTAKHVDIVLETVDSTTAIEIKSPLAKYSAPYILDFEFGLADQDDQPLIVDPSTFQVSAREDGTEISSTETGLQVRKVESKPLVACLVLDYSNSIASIQANGDSDQNGRSDAIDAMEDSAKDFIDALPVNARIGIVEFHREDVFPEVVSTPATDKEFLKREIDTIYDQYVQNFSAGSRVWDAIVRACSLIGEVNEDETRLVLFLSDGRDESSQDDEDSALSRALNFEIKLFAIGFGSDVNRTALDRLADSTGGNYFEAETIANIETGYSSVLATLRARYQLRWVTLKRGSTSFTPSFSISLGDATVTYTAPPFTVRAHEGDPLGGLIRVQPYEKILDTAEVYLNAKYVPRYVRRLRFTLYSPYDLVSASVVSGSDGGLLSSWKPPVIAYDEFSDTYSVDVESQQPLNINTSIPFGAFGPLLRLNFESIETESPTALGALSSDNSIYEDTGRQYFLVEWSDEPAFPRIGLTTSSVTLELGAASPEIAVINREDFVLDWHAEYDNRIVSIVPDSGSGNSIPISISPVSCRVPTEGIDTDVIFRNDEDFNNYVTLHVHINPDAGWLGYGNISRFFELGNGLFLKMETSGHTEINTLTNQLVDVAVAGGGLYAKGVVTGDGGIVRAYVQQVDNTWTLIIDRLSLKNLAHTDWRRVHETVLPHTDVLAGIFSGSSRSYLLYRSGKLVTLLSDGTESSNSPRQLFSLGSVIRKIIELRDGGYCLVLDDQPQYLVRLDANFDEIWRTPLPEFGQALLERANGDILVLNSSASPTFDANGVRLAPSLSLPGGIIGAINTTDDGYLVLGTQTGAAFVARYGRNDEFLWDRIYPTSGAPGVPSTGIALSSGGYLIGGVGIEAFISSACDQLFAKYCKPCIAP